MLFFWFSSRVEATAIARKEQVCVSWRRDASASWLPKPEMVLFYLFNVETGIAVSYLHHSDYFMHFFLVVKDLNHKLMQKKKKYVSRKRYLSTPLKQMEPINS